MKKSSFFAFAVLALATQIASAYDPSPLQDFCVGVDEPNYGLFVNGKFCKDPNLVVADDFYTSGLDVPASTDNADGYNVTGINVERLPGLNTMGLSLARFDYATYGVNPPHVNPRASEIITVVTGKLYMGFMHYSYYQERSRLFWKVMKSGDVFVFPMGLPHFQMNIENTPAVALAAFNGQDPGKVPMPVALFGSFPPIRPEVLARSLRLDRKVIEYLQAQFQNSTSP